MPYSYSMKNALRLAGDMLTLRQRGAASTNTTTQVTTYGPDVDTVTYGKVRPIVTGDEGIEMQAMQMEFFLPKRQLDDLSITPKVGDYLVREDGSLLLILEVETQTKAGYYHGRARG